MSHTVQYNSIRPGKLDYLFLIHKNLDFHVGGRSFFIIHYYIKCSKSGYLLLLRLGKAFKKLILMFYHCFRAATEAIEMISCLLRIEIHVHVIDNGNNEIRGGGVERDAGRDEKQVIKFAWPNNMSWLRCRLGFSLLHSTIMCIGGCRSSSGRPLRGHVPASIDLALEEGRFGAV